MIEIALTDHPNQEFSVVLNRRRVTLRFWYAVFNDRWSFDVSVDDLPVLQGRKIVSGVDLLAPFNLDLGVIFAYSEKNLKPGRENLVNGSVKVYHTSTEELENAKVAT